MLRLKKKKKNVAGILQLLIFLLRFITFSFLALFLDCDTLALKATRKKNVIVITIIIIITVAIIVLNIGKMLIMLTVKKKRRRSSL